MRLVEHHKSIAAGLDNTKSVIIVPYDPDAISEVRKETPWQFTRELIPPFVIAGVGMVISGVLLQTVETWRVFEHLGELVPLVPPLLALKGNLEMTFASRVSTLVSCR